jgi:hypothetical protein
MILHDTRKFFTKIIKPKNKILGFSKLKMIVKMQDGIMSNGNNNGENSNFILQFMMIWISFCFLCLHSGQPRLWDT